MKNYVKVWYTEVFDSLNNLFSADFGSTPEESLAAAQTRASGMIPPGSAGSPNMLYYLINKFRLVEIIDSVAFQLDPLNNPSLFTPDKQVALDWNTKSDLWEFDPNDPRAVLAEKIAHSTTQTPKLNFSGAAGLVTFVSLLPALAAVLKKEGRTRDAGIVLEVYNNITSGRMTVTDGLAELRQNGIP